MAREQFTLRHRLRVRWAEVDRQSIVFNGNYFAYFDVGVTEYWRAIGIELPQGYGSAYGTEMFAVKATAEYHGPALYDDVLDLFGRAAKLGRSSLHLQFEIWRGDEHLVSGELIFVNTDPATRKPVPLSADLRARILAYESVRPEMAQVAV